jgi:hypothetical protein
MNCAYCHTTRFGLARYQLLTSKGYVYFDRKRCRDDYLKAIQEESLWPPIRPVRFGQFGVFKGVKRGRDRRHRINYFL